MESLLAKLYRGEDLSFEESRRGVEWLMGEEMEPIRATAFLVALKLKGETPVEIAGGARAMQQAARRVRVSGPLLLDTCGTGGDGLGTINISTASAILLAAAGIPVAKHGNRAISSKAGSADVLEALGVRLDLDAEANERLLGELGLAFLFAPRYHPAMKRVMPIRRTLRTRTLFNLLGPLSNPAQPTSQVLGVFSEALLRPMAEALREMGLARAMVVHGSGLDEIALHDRTRVVVLEEGELREEELDCRELGIAPAAVEELAGGDAAQNARVLEAVLGGRDRGARARAVALNAAAGLQVAGRESEWRAAYDAAWDLLRSGEALKLLRRWAEATQDLA